MLCLSDRHKREVVSMKKKQLERKFRELLKIKPVIVQEGRLITHLLHELSLNPDRSGCRSSMVKAMLEHMASNGEIILTKRGEVYDAVEVVTVEVSSIEAEPSTSTEQNADQAGNFTTTKDESPVSSMSIVKSKKGERLTLALMALQGAADQNGAIHESRTDVIIKRELEITLGAAQSLNGILGKLGLRKSSRGRSAKPAWVDMGISEVTDEMLATIHEKPLATEQPVLPAAGEDAATPEGDVTMSPARREEELGKIILALERELDTARETIQRHELSISQGQVYMGAASRKIEEQKAELDLKDEEIRQLTVELEPLRAIGQLNPSPVTVEILQRHGKI